MNKTANKTMLAFYEKANTIMKGFCSNTLVCNDVVFPHWVTCSSDSGDDCLWYRKETKKGTEYRLVDIKNYVTNNQFYVYLFLIVVGIYFSFFNVSEYFFINFIIKFVGFYIFSIPIVSLTFNSKRNILIEELN